MEKSMTQAQEQSYAVVCSFLRQAFGELAQPKDEFSAVAVSLGGTVWVDARPFRDDEAYVCVYCWIGHGIEVTPEIALALLEMNNRYVFGKSALDSEGDILLEHMLPADGLTKAALAGVVRSIASVGSEMDDELRMRFS